jgi:Ras-related protein Rab-30
VHSTFGNFYFESEGNKTDRDDREIPTYVGEDFGQRNNMYFLETSAKECNNVEKLFMDIAHALIEQAKVQDPHANYRDNSGQVSLSKGQTTTASEGCCGRLL